MTATEAKALLEPIPEKFWIAGRLSDGERCCAVGHLRRLKVLEATFFALDTDRLQDAQLKVLRQRVDDELVGFCGVYKFSANRFDISAVNDGIVPQYKQESIKGRVLAYLDDRIVLESQLQTINQSQL